MIANSISKQSKTMYLITDCHITNFCTWWNLLYNNTVTAKILIQLRQVPVMNNKFLSVITKHALPLANMHTYKPSPKFKLDGKWYMIELLNVTSNRVEFNQYRISDPDMHSNYTINGFRLVHLDFVRF